MRSNSGKPLGIYVHIPFCKSKCEYCDFYSLGGSPSCSLFSYSHSIVAGGLLVIS